MYWPSKPHRRGSTIIEVAICVALLITAMTALAKLSRSSASLAHQSNLQLSTQLAAENVLARAAGMSAEQLSMNLDTIADQVAQSMHCQIETRIESIDSGQLAGIHFVVTATRDDQVAVTLHDWRLVSPAEGGQS